MYACFTQLWLTVFPAFKSVFTPNEGNFLNLFKQIGAGLPKSFVGHSTAGVMFLSFFFSLTSCIQWVFTSVWGWSDGATVLSKLPVSGRPANFGYSRAMAYCACSRCGWDVAWTVSLSSVISLFFLPLSGKRPDIE